MNSLACSQGVTLQKKALEREREREREKHMTNNKRSACAIEEQSV
jgi:hypothetical protein